MIGEWNTTLTVSSDTIFSNAAPWNSAKGRSVLQSRDGIDPIAQMDIWMKFYKKITL